MKTFLTIICLFQLNFLAALLSPINQSIKEIESILQEPKLALLLGEAHEIQSITRTKEGYLVSTESAEIAIDLIYDKEGSIGPKQYKLLFHQPIKR